MKQSAPPSSWWRSTLEEVAEVRGGYAFKSSQYTDEGEFILRTVNISDEGFIVHGKDKFISPEDARLHKKFQVKEGDTLFVMVGATLGKIGHVTGSDLPALLNQNMWVIRALNERVHPEFLTELYREITADVVANSRGAARSFVRRDDVRKLTVFLPQIEQQLKILEQIEKTKDHFGNLSMNLNSPTSPTFANPSCNAPSPDSYD
jgi:type I restriction enzyme S subunit